MEDKDKEGFAEPRRVPDRKMPDEDRTKFIAMLKDMLERLESGRENSMQFAISLKTDDEPDATSGALWGSGENLLGMVSQLSEPLIKPLLNKLKAVAALQEGAGMPRGLNQEDREAAELPN
jgi:hypothetical protein